MNVTIKNLPPDIAEGLRRTAAEMGRSLNSHVVALLTEANAEAARRRDMQDAVHELKAFVKTLPPMPDSAEILREERAERERRHR